MPCLNWRDFVSIYLSPYQSINHSIYVSIYLSISPSIYPSIHPSNHKYIEWYNPFLENNFNIITFVEFNVCFWRTWFVPEDHIRPLRAPLQLNWTPNSWNVDQFFNHASKKDIYPRHAVLIWKALLCNVLTGHVNLGVSLFPHILLTFETAWRNLMTFYI